MPHWPLFKINKIRNKPGLVHIECQCEEIYSKPPKIGLLSVC